MTANTEDGDHNHTDVDDNHVHDHSHIRRETIDLSSIASANTSLSNLSPLPDLLISNYHGGDFDLQSRIVTAIAQAGIRRFMPAEFSHDSTNAVVQKLLPPYYERHRVLELLKSQKDVEWIGLATGYPIDVRLVSGHMGIDPTWQSATVYGTGTFSFPASSTEFIGRAVASVIKHWNQFANQYLCLSGMQTTLNEVLRVLEKRVGREWSTIYVEAEKCAEEAEKRMQGGWPDAGMFLMERSLLSDEKAIVAGFQHDVGVAKQMGLAEDDLAMVLPKVLHDLEHKSGGCGCS